MVPTPAETMFNRKCMVVGGPSFRRRLGWCQHPSNRCAYFDTVLCCVVRSRSIRSGSASGSARREAWGATGADQRPGAARGKRPSTVPKHHDHTQDKNHGALLRRVRTEIMRSAGGGNVLAKVWHVLAGFDANNNHEIDKHELKACLDSLGISMDEGELDVLVELLDVDGDGILDLEEFALLLSGHSIGRVDGRGLAELKQTLARMHTDHDSMVLNFKAAFDELDEDRSGLIDATELRHAMEMIGVEVTQAEAARILNLCDREGRGAIDHLDFARLFQPSTKLARTDKASKPSMYGGVVEQVRHELM